MVILGSLNKEPPEERHLDASSRLSGANCSASLSGSGDVSLNAGLGGSQTSHSNIWALPKLEEKRARCPLGKQWGHLSGGPSAYFTWGLIQGSFSWGTRCAEKQMPMVKKLGAEGKMDQSPPGPSSERPFYRVSLAEVQRGPARDHQRHGGSYHCGELHCDLPMHQARGRSRLRGSGSFGTFLQGVQC